MSDHDETLADIVAEKRGMAEEIRANLSNVPARREDQLLEADSLDREADRIEAAWKREKSELEASALAVGGVVETPRHAPVGNSAAMREALVKIRRNLTMTYQSEEEERNLIVEAFNIAGEALAAPPRNCDVGTVEEQIDRFLRFCLSRGCVNCEIGDSNQAKFQSCELAWAQMPYEEGGAK